MAMQQGCGTFSTQMLSHPFFAGLGQLKEWVLLVQEVAKQKAAMKAIPTNVFLQQELEHRRALDFSSAYIAVITQGGIDDSPKHTHTPVHPMFKCSCSL